MMRTHLIVAQGDLAAQVWPRSVGASAASAAESRRRTRGSLRRLALPGRCQEQHDESKCLRCVCK